MKPFTALVIALVSLALLGSAVSFAQDATPAASTFPITPDPAECQVEARPVEDFLAAAAGATPGAAAETVVEVPLGDAADAETVAGVTVTLREVLACFNAGEFSRALGLFSDNALRRFGQEEPLSEEELRGFLEATPQAVPAEQRSTLHALTDVMELEDGRVGALLITTDAVVGTDTIYVVLVQEDGRWLVDDIIEFLEPGGIS